MFLGHDLDFLSSADGVRICGQSCGVDGRLDSMANRLSLSSGYGQEIRRDLAEIVAVSAAIWSIDRGLGLSSGYGLIAKCFGGENLLGRKWLRNYLAVFLNIVQKSYLVIMVSVL